MEKLILQPSIQQALEVAAVQNVDKLKDLLIEKQKTKEKLEDLERDCNLTLKKAQEQFGFLIENCHPGNKKRDEDRYIMWVKARNFDEDDVNKIVGV